MQLFSLIFSIIIGAAIVSLDVLFAFVGRIGKLSALSAVLHPPLLIFSFLAGASLMTLALIMMASAALLTLSFYVKHVRERRGRGDI